jgi:hypothetical protein
VLDDATAHGADLGLGIEQGEIDGDLGRGQSDVVLGVEVARVAQLDHRRRALAADRGGPEVDLAARLELGQAREGFGGGPAHRPEEVVAGQGRGEHVGDEQPVGDLDALLVGQRAPALVLELPVRRDEAGEAARPRARRDLRRAAAS